MTKDVVRFRSKRELYEADSCEALKVAVRRGETELHAFGRGGYPGQQLPDHVLRQVRAVGFWSAPYDQRWGLDWHRNEGIEICYVSKGHAAFQVAGGEEHELKAGCVTVTRPWQMHRVGNPRITACTLHWLILDVGVRRPNQRWVWPPWLGLSDRDLYDLTTLLSTNEQPVWRGDSDIRDSYLRLAKLVQDGHADRDESRIRLQIGELLVALTELLRRAEPDLDRSLVSSERTVQLFLGSLATRLDEPWTLDTMAKECGLGRSQFAQYCQQLTNATPGRFLNNLRIDRAKDLLSSPMACSISDIAVQCGFGTSQYFATAFRKRTGIAPSDYRAVTRDRLEHAG